MTPAESLTRKDNFLPTAVTAIVERQSRLDVVIFLAPIWRRMREAILVVRTFIFAFLPINLPIGVFPQVYRSKFC